MRLVCLALIGAIGCNDSSSRRAQAVHDVVLIVAEGLRADEIELGDDTASATPALRRFSSDAVVHARATSPATSCVPAHGSLLTGRWPSFHGAEQAGDGTDAALALDADAATIAELLDAAGFRSVAFVGNASDLRREVGFARGFDEYETEPSRTRGAGLGTAVASWLGRHPERSFLFVNVADVEVGSESGGKLADADRAAARARYRRALGDADRSVGGVLEALRAAGRYDEALVVVTSDHGELLGEHGMVGHGKAPFEPVVHVPLLVKYPGRERAGEWVDRRVSTMAVFATILESAGVALPAEVQARPLHALHPVWVEDVDRDGARMRVGYDGPDVKLMSLRGDSGEAACMFILDDDPGELRPNCDVTAATPLRAALASFSRRDRPPRVPTARMPAPRSSVGPDVARVGG
jgi:arylsulfatase A-like enzyme